MAENTPLTALGRRFRNAWNLLTDRNDEVDYRYDIGPGYAFPRHKPVTSISTSQSLVSAVYNRCAIDVSQLTFKHVRTNENGGFLGTVQSGLNDRLTLSANIDQSSLAFMQDLVYSMFDEGVVAIVPTDTSVNMQNSQVFDILSWRVAKVLDWYPLHVRLEVYNDRVGEKEELIIEKRLVAIIENPLYAVMNEPNSTLKRLINKLNLLDAIDEQSGSGRLDLIVQLPYVIKSDQRRKMAEDRLTAIENQLKDSKYGVAYADGTEKIIQLNRPAENNLMAQIEYLTSMLYSQLGMSDAIFSGTASPEEFLNYYNRTVNPIANAIALEFKRKFLSTTAITQGQDIRHFRNPLTSITAMELAELADKLTRNEILSSNELRGVIGYEPSSDPGADELRNKNLNVSNTEANNLTKENQNDREV